MTNNLDPEVEIIKDKMDMKGEYDRYLYENSITPLLNGLGKEMKV